MFMFMFMFMFMVAPWFAWFRTSPALGVPQRRESMTPRDDLIEHRAQQARVLRPRCELCEISPVGKERKRHLGAHVGHLQLAHDEPKVLDGSRAPYERRIRALHGVRVDPSRHDVGIPPGTRASYDDADPHCRSARCGARVETDGTCAELTDEQCAAE
jgi:hypothetical protein